MEVVQDAGAQLAIPAGQGQAVGACIACTQTSTLAPGFQLSTQAEHDAGFEELSIMQDEAKWWQRIARFRVLARKTWVPILRMDFRMQAEQNACLEQPTIVREEAQRRASRANPSETRSGLL